MVKTVAALALGIGALAVSPAPAHFQTVYTPDVNLAEPATVPVDLIFWHPLSSGAVMNMGKPEEFFMVHRGERTDLLGTLKPITFTSWNNSGAAYQAEVKLQSPGDYILALVPEPYFEESEDKYIQQITKTYVNRGQLPTEWHDAIGLKAEIVPLNKPYNILAGSTFSGIVMADGKPVPDAEIEVEYVAALPDMVANKTGEPTASEMPGGAIVIYSDANGQFSFTVPRAGVWGFAALNIGPDTEYMGKPLSQDAVLWINATDFGGGPTVVAAAAAPTAGSPVAAVAGATAGLSADVREQLSASIRSELRPIRTDLAVYRAESSYPVILGGIGFIIGLAGLAYYINAFQRARKAGV